MATTYIHPQLAICKWAVTYTRLTINCLFAMPMQSTLVRKVLLSGCLGGWGVGVRGGRGLFGFSFGFLQTN